MKRPISSLLKLAVAALAAFPAYAVAVAPTTGAYVSDPQNEYVHDATSDSIGTVNMILCILGGMNINDSGMLNKGPYIALIDMNNCKSSSGSSSSSGDSSGASTAKNYMTAIVDASRANSSTPMIAKIWMSMTEQGNPMNISLRLSASQSPTEVPPYGVFRLDYIGKDSGGAIKFNGYIDSSSGNLQFFESNSSPNDNVAMSLTPGVTTSTGSGTVAKGTSPSVTTYNFNYNSPNFRRGDLTGVTSQDRCFSRLKADASKSVWRYGTYKNSDGTRVDQANPGFPITATYSGSSYYGYASYYGLGFQGLDLNTIADANPISGLVITDQRPGNTTTYNLSKVGGKLIKWTQNATTLTAMDGIPFNFNGDMTSKTNNASGTNLVTSWGNWQMKWSAGSFYVTGMQNCTISGCNLTTFATPDLVNSTAFNSTPISGWSDSFGGNFNIPSTGSPHANGDSVSYYSQSIVTPGSATPTTLYCLNNCPDATSVAAANAYSTGTAPSPYGGSTAIQWYSAPSGNTVSYTFDASGLKNSAASMIITNPSFYTGQYQWGVMSGRLFDNVFASCGSGIVCEPSNPATYYTWSTGLGQWNQSMWLTKTSDSSVVAFDPPQNIAYPVPNDLATYGTWANKTIQLQFNGFGNLYGIPGYCVSPVDNTQVDCAMNTRYVPMFSIPDAATMTLNSTTLIVKALDAELRLKDLGPGASTSACTGLPLSTLPLPTGGTHNMTNTGDAYYIGIKPPITSSPKVIDGIVQ